MLFLKVEKTSCYLRNNVVPTDDDADNHYQGNPDENSGGAALILIPAFAALDHVAHGGVRGFGFNMVQI